MRNIILALCALAIIAGVGYYMTKSNDDKPAISTASSQTTSKIDEKPMVTLNTQPATKPAPAPKAEEPKAEQTPAATTEKPAEQPTPTPQESKPAEQPAVEKPAEQPVAEKPTEQPETEKPAEQPTPAPQEPKPAEQAAVPMTPAGESDSTNTPAPADAANNAIAENKPAESTPAAQAEAPKAEEKTEVSKDEPKADNNGIQIDPSGAKINFLSYKMPGKMKVPETGNPATFKSVEFNFANENGSIAKILTNSTAKFDLTSIDTNKNPIRDNNVKNKFFAHLASKEVVGKIVSVKGDDTKGEISLSLNFNGIEKVIPLIYEVKDGKIVAEGMLDLVEGNLFNTAEAFEKFASDPVIQGLHGKKSWSDI
ncbi:MAG: YceI family protein, partial [Campylobacter sp.]|nr:YceI family protein [Campylobacter sp.]